MFIYLSGSIEYAAGNGKAWRAELTPFLESLGHEVYDPAADEKKNLTDEEVGSFRAWKTTDPERFATAVRKIIHWDLNIVEQLADCVVCFWDESAGRGAGTQGELTAAFRANKPVLLVTSMSREAISGWILGCATMVFDDFAALKAFLATEAQRARSGL